MHRICIRHSHYISGAKKSKHVSQGMCGFLNIWTPLGKSLSNAGMTDKVRRGVEQRRRVVTTASPICHQRAHGAFFSLLCPGSAVGRTRWGLPPSSASPASLCRELGVEVEERQEFYKQGARAGGAWRRHNKAGLCSTAVSQPLAGGPQPHDGASGQGADPGQPVQTGSLENSSRRLSSLVKVPEHYGYSKDGGLKKPPPLSAVGLSQSCVNLIDCYCCF